MGQLEQVVQRHGWDRVKDMLFIGAAVLMTAVAIGSVTSKAKGSAEPTAWNSQVQVVDGDLNAAR